MPHELPNGDVSTLFDEFMLDMAGVSIPDGFILHSRDWGFYAQEYSPGFWRAFGKICPCSPATCSCFLIFYRLIIRARAQQLYYFISYKYYSKASVQT